MWPMMGCTRLQKKYLNFLIYTDRNLRDTCGNKCGGCGIMVEIQPNLLITDSLSLDSAINGAAQGVRKGSNSLVG